MLEDYVILRRCGGGRHGTVSRATRKADGRACVVKVVSLDWVSYKDKEEALNELRVMATLCHSHVIRYLDSFIENEALCIVMDYAANGDLSSFISKKRVERTEGLRMREEEREMMTTGGATGFQRQPPSPLEVEGLVDEDWLWKMLVEIGQGLQYLHARRILHRDIKPSNIFLDENNNAMIGDLGLSRVLDPHAIFAHTEVGTPLYFSPELCEGKPYNHKTDVWAFGCLVFELATGRPPFEATNQIALAKKIVGEQTPPLPQKYSAELQFVVHKMLEKDMSKRPSIDQILEMSTVRSWIERLRLKQQEREMAKLYEKDNRERRRKAEELARANIFVRALHYLNVKFYQYNCTLALVSPDQQVLIAIHALRDEAASFARSLVRAANCSDDPVAYSSFTSLTEFLKLLRERFADVARSVKASDRLQTIHARKWKSARALKSTMDELVAIHARKWKSARALKSTMDELVAVPDHGVTDTQLVGLFYRAIPEALRGHFFAKSEDPATTYDSLSREVVAFEAKSASVSTFWHKDLDKGKQWKGRTISGQVKTKDSLVLTLDEGSVDEIPYDQIEWGLEEEDNGVGQGRSYAAVAVGGRPQGGRGQGQGGRASGNRFQGDQEVGGRGGNRQAGGRGQGPPQNRPGNRVCVVKVECGSCRGTSFDLLIGLINQVGTGGAKYVRGVRPVVGVSVKMLGDYVILYRCGGGSHGTVYRATRKADGRACVVKVVSLDRVSYKDKEEALNECRVMATLCHSYVIRYLESFIENEALCIVMDYAANGDLSSFISRKRVERTEGMMMREEEERERERERERENQRCHRQAGGSGGENGGGGRGCGGGLVVGGGDQRKMMTTGGATGFQPQPPSPLEVEGLVDEDWLWKMLVEIGQGLQYLHARRILHRDIKPSNIFLDENNNAMIGDLGLSRVLDPHAIFAHTEVGTPLYFSPELCEGKPYNHKTDVWAFGCLVFELATGHPPFEAMNQIALAKKIVGEQTPPLPEKYSAELQFLVHKMLEKDMSKRPSIDQILEMSTVRSWIERLRLTQQEREMAKLYGKNMGNGGAEQRSAGGCVNNCPLLREECETLRSQLLHQQNVNLCLESKLRSCEIQCSELATELGKNREAMNEMQMNYAASEAQNRDLLGKLSQMRSSHDDLLLQLKSTEQKREELISHLADWIMQCKDLNLRLNASESVQAKLKAACAENDLSNNQLRCELAAKKKRLVQLEFQLSRFHSLRDLIETKQAGAAGSKLSPRGTSMDRGGIGNPIIECNGTMELFHERSVNEEAEGDDGTGGIVVPQQADDRGSGKDTNTNTAAGNPKKAIVKEVGAHGGGRRATGYNNATGPAEGRSPTSNNKRAMAGKISGLRVIPSYGRLSEEGAQSVRDNKYLGSCTPRGGKSPAAAAGHLPEASDCSRHISGLLPSPGELRSASFGVRDGMGFQEPLSLPHQPLPHTPRARQEQQQQQQQQQQQHQQQQQQHQLLPCELKNNHQRNFQRTSSTGDVLGYKMQRANRRVSSRHLSLEEFPTVQELIGGDELVARTPPPRLQPLQGYRQTANSDLSGRCTECGNSTDFCGGCRVGGKANREAEGGEASEDTTRRHSRQGSGSTDKGYPEACWRLSMACPCPSPRSASRAQQQELATGSAVASNEGRGGCANGRRRGKNVCKERDRRRQTSLHQAAAGMLRTVQTHPQTAADLGKARPWQSVELDGLGGRNQFDDQGGVNRARLKTRLSAPSWPLTTDQVKSLIERVDPLGQASRT
ncbi:hypothetical protein CBR_g12290 [Chara braunii]|uniref:non-specific serine/threonine protein kinase n=1 Tax=Chara braunii TaxID=69332 RepID=A0A388KRM9_CHABU|nr:hypothetical protein CBR_g12290 [Chara braunii]|eukprot:GBG72721.1 hypothetical protein CBR_g12290 [Chara braunii]